MQGTPLGDAIDRIWAFDPSTRQEATSEGLRRARRLVSSRCGIISKVEFQRMRAGEPQVYWAHSSPPLSYQGTGRPIRHHGFGVSTIAERAAMKSIGESIERYCAAPPPECALTYASFAALNHKKRLIRPLDFTFFSEFQYRHASMPFSKPSEDAPLHWVEGISLISGDPILIPAFLVYAPWSPDDFGYRTEERFAYPISTGLACGATFETAIYRGLLEVVERDAFMLSWRHERTMPSIESSAAKRPLTKSLLRAIDDIPVTCVLKRATIDISINVVLAAFTNSRDRFPLFAMGAGADFDFEHALVLALEEALLCYCGLVRVESPDRLDELAELENGINPLALHGLAHATNSALHDMRRCLVERTAPVSSLSDMKNVGSVGALIQELAGMGHEAVAVDLTQSDVDACGFKVVRVLVPGLQPLDIDARWPYLQPKRSVSIGYRESEAAGALLQAAINRLPHPFA